MPPRPLRQPRLPLGPELPATQRIDEAFYRLDRERLLGFLVSSALSVAELKRLLVGRMSRALGKELPVEMYGQLAVGAAFADAEFADELAAALHDRLAWDREPAAPEEWERMAQDRPLEALWTAALSEAKSVRRGFSKFAVDCRNRFRASPACHPPSWELLDASVEMSAGLADALGRQEKESDEAGRRLASERQRLEELREQLRQLRRENSELRAERADGARRAAVALERDRLAASAQENARVDELERRLRKTEKEREHLARELERLELKRATKVAGAARATAGPGAAVSGSEVASYPDLEAVATPAPELGLAPSPRVRILRQMLRKLMKKRKIGAAHTHEDNVYRGIPDHEKGLAKEAMELLYREGILVPKSTIADPHVSLHPERVPEVEAILAGTVANPRLATWLNGRG